LKSLQEGLRFRPDVVLSSHMVCAPAAAILRRSIGVPYVLYVYADELSATPEIARFAMRHAHTVIAISKYTRDLAVSVGGDPRRIKLILPGVDLPEHVRRQRRKRPTMLTIAGMVKRYKGHDVMVRALPLIRARVPDAEWVVVGAGPLEQLYRDMVQDARLEDAVYFAGKVTDAERDGWLDSADVFVMPSRLRPDGGGGEGFGIVYLEAGAHGAPAVGGNVAGALDAVLDGETGLLVDPTDHVVLANAVADLLLDRERAEQMGTAGREWATRHTWPQVAERVRQVLTAAASR
jgi:phosphatidylinositol alpha-1,6-mannosyltransferase